MKTGQLFYIQREENVAGPYDLVQMAGLLRKKIITSETMTRGEGEDEWKPFSWQPQFSVAREMSPDAISMRALELDEQAQVEKTPILLPSRGVMLQIAAAVVLSFVLGAIVFFISRASVTLGACLAVAGVACALLGTCLGYVRLADESGWTLLKVFFIPCYDIYYLISNFWDYFPYLCMKYVGGIVAVAAFAGLASSHSADADQLRSMLHLYGS